MNLYETVLLDAKRLELTLNRISFEILEHTEEIEKLALVGIRTRGVNLAQRIAKRIEKLEGQTLNLGALDINLYRDDIAHSREQPIVGRTEIPFSVNGHHIVLIDDVLYTGRTIRAALDAIIDFGRPGSIRLVVLVDRGMRQLPIQPDIVGLNISTKHDEIVKVRLQEIDGVEEVVSYIQGSIDSAGNPTSNKDNPNYTTQSSKEAQ